MFFKVEIEQFFYLWNESDLQIVQLCFEGLNGSSIYLLVDGGCFANSDLKLFSCVCGFFVLFCFVFLKV